MTLYIETLYRDVRGPADRRGTPPKPLCPATLNPVTMRSVTYRLTPKTGYYGRIGRFFAENRVWVVAIHNLDPLRDDSVVMQFEVADSRDRIRACLESEDWVRNYEFTSIEDNTVFQMHFTPQGLHREIYELHRSYPVLLEYPIEVVDQESQAFRVVEVGREEDLRELIKETRNKIDVEVEQVASYEPVAYRRYAELTERQQEVVRTAIELGYYESPRKATYEDIAGDLGCSPSAVGQHLRRAEAKVMSAVRPASPGNTG